MEKLFLQSFSLQDSNLSFFMSLNLLKANLEFFRVWEGNNRLSLMTQYWPCITGKCHIFMKLFKNLKTRLRKCYHATIKSPHFTFFVKLMQRWYNIVIPTSRRRCEFNIVVSTLYQVCHYNIHDMIWYTSIQYSWHTFRWRENIENYP